ncbi:MAG TPA: hypothetical protein VIU87_15060 [Mycobacterium sp.]
MALPDVLGTKIGRLVAAEFTDPARLSALGVNRLIRFAAAARRHVDSLLKRRTPGTAIDEVYSST